MSWQRSFNFWVHHSQVLKSKSFVLPLSEKKKLCWKPQLDCLVVDPSSWYLVRSPTEEPQKPGGSSAFRDSCGLTVIAFVMWRIWNCFSSSVGEQEVDSHCSLASADHKENTSMTQLDCYTASPYEMVVEVNYKTDSWSFYFFPKRNSWLHHVFPAMSIENPTGSLLKPQIALWTEKHSF